MWDIAISAWVDSSRYDCEQKHYKIIFWNFINLSSNNTEELWLNTLQKINININLKIDNQG